MDEVCAAAPRAARDPPLPAMADGTVAMLRSLLPPMTLPAFALGVAFCCASSAEGGIQQAELLQWRADTGAAASVRVE
jgi:hypothetical protein